MLSMAMQAALLINTILKPFETLTRSFSRRAKPAATDQATADAGSGSGAAPPSQAADSGPHTEATPATDSRQDVRCSFPTPAASASC